MALGVSFAGGRPPAANCPHLRRLEEQGDQWQHRASIELGTGTSRQHGHATAATHLRGSTKLLPCGLSRQAQRPAAITEGAADD